MPDMASGATVIRPPRAWPGVALGELWRDRAICFVLARRNLMVRYRQTIVGAAWALIQPIMLMVLFSIFFGFLGRLPSSGLPYPLFFFLGLLPWHMTAKILNEGSSSIVANRSLVTRVYLPRAYFPLSVALASVVDFVLGAGALLILLIIYAVVPGPAVVVVPLLVAVAWITGLGVAYWLSALNVAYRDIAQLLPFFTQLWMFGSPIIYPSTLVPEAFRPLYFINPMALVIEGMRWAVADAQMPAPESWLLGIVSAVVVLVSGYIFFRKRESTFADYV